MKKIELICVSSDNNNKYYRMEENADGTFTARWGRVGYAEQTQTYSAGLWNSKYKEKIRRGYKDISNLKVQVTSSTFKDVLDKKIQILLNDLQNFSKTKISQNYSVGTSAVTLAQVDAAQEIIDRLAIVQKDNTLIDKSLMELYTIIPRHMSDVRRELFKNNINSKDWLANKIATEQALLDVMRQQVELNKIDNKVDQTLEDALGIKIVNVEDSDTLNQILTLLGNENNKFSKAFALINYTTEGRFKAQIKNSHSDKTSVLWHGSRNENWLNIIKTGLLIRPSGVDRKSVV